MGISSLEDAIAKNLNVCVLSALLPELKALYPAANLVGFDIGEIVRKWREEEEEGGRQTREGIPVNDLLVKAAIVAGWAELDCSSAR